MNVSSRHSRPRIATAPSMLGILALAVSACSAAPGPESGTGASAQSHAATPSPDVIPPRLVGPPATPGARQVLFVDGDHALVLHDLGSNAVTVVDASFDGEELAMSPMGDRIAYVRWTADPSAASGRSPQFFVRALPSGPPKALLRLPNGGAARPVWSPDGKKLAFATETANPSESEVEVLDVDGGGPPEVIATTTVHAAGGSDCFSPDWSPDGTQLVFTGGDATHARLITYDFAHSTSRIVRESTTMMCEPKWSPSGAEIAFAEFSRENLWSLSRVAAAGGPSELILTLDGHDAGQIQWAPDGNALAFVDFDRTTVDAVVVTVAAALWAVPQTVAHTGGGIIGGHPQWSPHADALLYEGFDQKDNRAHLYVIAADGANGVFDLGRGAGLGSTYARWVPSK